MLRLQSKNGVFISRLFSLHGRFLHLFSTSTTATTPNTFVDYLVSSLGFSEKEAIATSVKVRSLNTRRNPNSVVDFFKQNGFDDTQIKTIVYKRPDVLRSDVETILKPKFRALQDLGLSGSNLGDFIAGCPHTLFRNLNTQIVPAIDFLTSIFDTKEDVVQVLRKSHQWASIDVVTRNITLLQNYGVSIGRIQKCFVRYTYLLQLCPEKLQEICSRIEEKFGIPVESHAFLAMITVLTGNTAVNLNLKYQVFKSYGWTESDIGTMTRNQPACLMLSEVNLRRKLEYFMKELRLESGYIASHPTLLGFSLETRVVPRTTVLQVLKERKLISAGHSFYHPLKLSESQFLSKYVIPYKDELPGLFEAYSNKKMDSFAEVAN